MADCYYHGYSGGSGTCSLCQQEDRENKERGDITQDVFLTAEEVDGLWHKNNNIKQDKKKK